MCNRQSRRWRQRSLVLWLLRKERRRNVHGTECGRVIGNWRAEENRCAGVYGGGAAGTGGGEEEAEADWLALMN